MPTSCSTYPLLSMGFLRGVQRETSTDESPTESILRGRVCTRVYTIVYTRVYSPLLGSRYTMGVARPRAPRLLLRSMLLDYFALALG